MSDNRRIRGTASTKVLRILKEQTEASESGVWLRKGMKGGDEATETGWVNLARLLGHDEEAGGYPKNNSKWHYLYIRKVALSVVQGMNCRGTREEAGIPVRSPG